MSSETKEDLAVWGIFLGSALVIILVIASLNILVDTVRAKLCADYNYRCDNGEQG